MTAQQGATTHSGSRPDEPTELDRASWIGVLKRSVSQFKTDNISDWAAALTYRGVMALAPGLLVLVSILGLLGKSTTTSLTNNIGTLAPGGVKSTLQTIIDSVQSRSSAGVAAVVGVLLALWSASSYIAAFMRASNAIYEVGEGRPIWKTIPVRIGVTLAMVLGIVLSAIIAVFSGPLADRVGHALGFSGTVITVWSIVKWPILVIIVSLLLALLYYACPNVKQPGVPWVSPGGLLAVVIWVAASALFAVYVKNFGSYNKTYGSLASVIIFLVWLWITNVAILLGAEFNAELQHGRAIQAGLPADQTPFMEPRDTRKLTPDSEEQATALGSKQSVKSSPTGQH